jgi:hypothetical protein
MRTDRDCGGVRKELATLHVLRLLSIRGIARLGDSLCRDFVVRETHVSPGDTQAVGDPHQDVVGHDLTTLENLRHLGL